MSPGKVVRAVRTARTVEVVEAPTNVLGTPGPYVRLFYSSKTQSLNTPLPPSSETCRLSCTPGFVKV